jgi:serine/threonine protein phosphatase PrpC
LRYRGFSDYSDRLISTMIARDWGAATDRGRVRDVNEDAMLADPPLFLVADGMGGHAAGDVASRLAIDYFVDLVGCSSLTVEDTVAAVTGANAAIVGLAEHDPTQTGMGTTMAGLAVVAAGGLEHWLVFNIGDSRVYRLFRGKLSQLTVDHSEVEEMVAEGRITRDQARQHGRRNVVTRSLGSRPAPVPDSWLFPPVPGERFLVCSDGLTTELADADIERCAATIADPTALAQELVHRAVVAGGRDNITVVVDGPPDTIDGPDEATAPRAGGDG